MRDFRIELLPLKKLIPDERSHCAPYRCNVGEADRSTASSIIRTSAFLLEGEAFSERSRSDRQIIGEAHFLSGLHHAERSEKRIDSEGNRLGEPCIDYRLAVLIPATEQEFHRGFDSRRHTGDT